MARLAHARHDHAAWGSDNAVYRGHEIRVEARFQRFKPGTLDRNRTSRNRKIVRGRRICHSR
jgi:hypothetical protein